MRYLLTVLLIISSCKPISNFRVQDSESVFYQSINKYNEINDCSVRAVADLFDLSYAQALMITKKWGRRSGRGIPLNFLLYGIRKDFKDKIILATAVSKQVNAKFLVNHIVQDGYSYLAITTDHAFVVEQHKDVWYLKGNYNDKQKYLIAYIQIKN